LESDALTRKANQAEYSARMHRVVEHIDRHLDQELDLRALARVAHFSAFHFHRVFFSWTGETLGDYLRRRRLEIAAIRLAGQPKLSILNVALSVGFGSTEAFARAFKARFGCTASTWRAFIAQQRNSGQELRNPGQPSGASGTDNDGTVPTGAAMKVKLIERKPVKVTYLRHVGPYGQPLGEFWQRTVYPWMAANDQLGQPRYGISPDDPMITAGDKCRYDAAVEVRGKITVPGNSQNTTIPGGQYAVTAFRGTADQIGGVWDAMLREWLPNSGMQLDARPFLEYYPTDATFDPKTGVFSCDIAIPVAPL
jgi:AraC family transcriptional regulator